MEKFLELRLEFKLPMKIIKKSRWFLASCPVLDVHSQGKTEEAAKKALAEALALFLSSCFELGTLEQVLKECGFVPGHLPRRSRAPREEYVKVPLSLISQSQAEHACRV